MRDEMRFFTLITVKSQVVFKGFPSRRLFPEDLSAELLASNHEVQLVGDGAIRYADHFKDLKGVEPAEPGLAFPSASSLVQLAHAKALREDFVKPSELKPLYLRKPDALEIDKQKRRVDR